MIGGHIKNKYNAKRISLSGKKYDSLAESRRFSELSRQQRLGLITDLKRQVSFELIPAQYDENGKLLERAVTYKADFTYRKDGKLIVEDVKSKATKTDSYIIKRKLMLYVHKVKLVEIEERKK